MTYSTPPTFATGERLSAYKLRLLAANDDHQNGVADALTMVPATMGRGAIGTEDDIAVFDGYLYLTQNTVKYALYLANADSGAHVHLYFDYGGAGQVEMTGAGGWATAGQQTIQTFDATAFAKNTVYRIYALSSKPGGDAQYAELRYCYETYTGALSFTATNAFTDGGVSAAAHLQALADNDAFFRAIESENHPTIGHSHGYLASESSLVIWRGWVRHRHHKLFWKWALSTVTGTQTLKLYYDYDGGGEELVATLSTAVTEESSATLAGDFTYGTWYQVAVVMDRVDTGEGATGTIHYVEEGASAADAGYTPLGEFMPGQVVWGTTANMRTRLALLAANDTNLNGRLGMFNCAVKKALYPNLGANTNGTYAIRRRKNVLYYRGKNLTMTWGTDNSMSLNDYDGSHAFWTLDLGGVTDLAPGQVYYIASISSEAEFAQERES